MNAKKKHGAWEKPYTFDFVDGVKFISEQCCLPTNYNKLGLSFVDLENREGVVEDQCSEEELIHDAYLVPSRIDVAENSDVSVSDEEGDQPDILLERVSINGT